MAADKMKQPSTEAELKEFHNILKHAPHRYLDIVNAWIEEDPSNIEAYFDRHFAWMRLGQPLRAIEDMDRVIGTQGNQIELMTRGEIYRELGHHERALEDFARGEAIDPEEWEGHQVGLLYQADSHAKLGDLPAALAYCARLQDDFWTPGLSGAPAGGKAEIAEALRDIAAAAADRKT
jgi:tetratricopeptide (TPR) repeat protein